MNTYYWWIQDELGEDGYDKSAIAAAVGEGGGSVGWSYGSRHIGETAVIRTPLSRAALRERLEQLTGEEPRLHSEYQERVKTDMFFSGPEGFTYEQTDWLCSDEEGPWAPAELKALVEAIEDEGGFPELEAVCRKVLSAGDRWNILFLIGASSELIEFSPSKPWSEVFGARWIQRAASDAWDAWYSVLRVIEEAPKLPTWEHALKCGVPVWAEAEAVLVALRAMGHEEANEAAELLGKQIKDSSPALAKLVLEHVPLYGDLEEVVESGFLWSCILAPHLTELQLDAELGPATGGAA